MKYFTIQELTTTNSGLKNIPTEYETDNLMALVDNVLDPARELIGRAIQVNSGFRSREVNAKVGGVKNSQHLTGEAADIVCNDNKKLFEIIRDNLTFDQLINEKDYSWIHVSFSRIRNRKQILVIE